MEPGNLIPANYYLDPSSKTQFLKFVWEQLHKDFSPYVLNIIPPVSPDMKSLEDAARKLVGRVFSDHQSLIPEILYRVDVPETLGRQWAQKMHTEGGLEELTMIILRREALKVWFRHFDQP